MILTADAQIETGLSAPEVTPEIGAESARRGFVVIAPLVIDGTWRNQQFCVQVGDDEGWLGPVPLAILLRAAAQLWRSDNGAVTRDEIDDDLRLQRGRTARYIPTIQSALPQGASLLVKEGERTGAIRLALHRDLIAVDVARIANVAPEALRLAAKHLRRAVANPAPRTAQPVDEPPAEAPVSRDELAGLSIWALTALTARAAARVAHAYTISPPEGREEPPPARLLASAAASLPLSFRSVSSSESRSARDALKPHWAGDLISNAERARRARTNAGTDTAEAERSKAAAAAANCAYKTAVVCARLAVEPIAKLMTEAVDEAGWGLSWACRADPAVAAEIRSDFELLAKQPHGPLREGLFETAKRGGRRRRQSQARARLSLQSMGSQDRPSFFSTVANSDHGTGTVWSCNVLLNHEGQARLEIQGWRLILANGAHVWTELLESASVQLRDRRVHALGPSGSRARPQTPIIVSPRVPRVVHLRFWEDGSLHFSGREEERATVQAILRGGKVLELPVTFQAMTYNEDWERRAREEAARAAGVFRALPEPPAQHTRGALRVALNIEGYDSGQREFDGPRHVPPALRPFATSATWTHTDRPSAEGLQLFPHLRELSLADNLELRTLDDLAELQELRTLNLDRTNVRSLEPLFQLLALERLGLRRTPVRTLAALRGHPTLRDLGLNEVHLDDWKQLGDFPNLQALRLGGSGFRRPSLLKPLRKLRTLDLRNTPVPNVTPLRDHPTLTSLDLRNTAVRDIQPLATIPTLTHLLLEGTPVSDISACTELRQLTTLVLRGTKVTDLSPLANNPTLRDVDICETDVEDLSPLLTCPRLEIVHVENCPNLSPAQREELARAHPELEFYR